MNRILVTFLFASAVVLLFPFGSSAADDPDDVPVATYPNRPEFQKSVGDRVWAILYEHKINCVVTASKGATISVPANRAHEALQLLAKAIKAEKLQLTLLVPKGDRSAIITPDNVLKPKKAQ